MTISKVTTIYFSPTGTSRQIAEVIAMGTSVISRRSLNLTQPAKFNETIPSDELVIVAMPVYGGYIPPLAIERMKDIKSSGALAVPVVVYGNRAYEKALEELSDILKEKGFRIAGGATFIGEHSYSVQEHPIAQGRPDREDIALAKEFGKNLAAKIRRAKDMKAIPEVDVRRIRKPRQPFFSLLRFIIDVIRLRRSKTVLPKKPVTDAEKCTHCGLCANICPAGAIEKGKEEMTGDNCIKCCACVKKCPHKARTYDTPFAVILSKDFKYRKQPQYIL